MRRLTELEGDVVGEVDEKVVCALPKSVETTLHFDRRGDARGARFNAEDNAGVAEAVFVFDGDGERG